MRETLPPNRVICIARYSRSKCSRASLSDIEIICIEPLAAAPPVLSLGRCCGRDRTRRLAIGEDKQAFDHVSKLANIARPFACLQNRNGVVAEWTRLQAGGVGDPPHEVVDKIRYVLAPAIQRRNVDAARH